MPYFVYFSRRCIVLIDSLNEGIGKAVSWLTLLMVLCTFLIVLLRYVFDIGWVGMQESVDYMHVLVFMLGAAYTLKFDGHVRVDIFYQRCSLQKRAWIDFFGTLFLLFPVLSFIAWSSWNYVFWSWKIMEGSASSGGLPAVYLLKTTMLVMVVTLALQGVSLLLSSLLTALGIKPAQETI